MYTQNIDGLERLAGRALADNSSQVKDDNLVEAHGTFSTASCIKCRAVADPIQVRDAILAGNVPVVCDACSASMSVDSAKGFQDVSSAAFMLAVMYDFCF
ncbi:Sir2 histone deacetylase Hst2, partial [Perkinsus olseni]